MDSTNVILCLDAEADESERARPGLPRSFVVSVESDRQIEAGHIDVRDPGAAA